VKKADCPAILRLIRSQDCRLRSRESDIGSRMGLLAQIRQTGILDLRLFAIPSLSFHDRISS
jgi:hypothetical protein